MNEKLKEKLNESLSSVLPVTGIVLLLSVAVTPLDVGTLALFTVGATLLVFGMGLFSLGVDMSMLPMGEHMGSHITKLRRLPLILPLCFFMGTAITIAEPDLTVLAGQVPHIPNMTIIVTVAAGVGIFLVAAFLRLVFRLSLRYLLLGLYAVVFGLAFFVPPEFLAVAFDSGGVTTGPITVPFIMSIGIGMASVVANSRDDDSFGLIALCSIGPILSVMILSIFYPTGAGAYTPIEPVRVADSRELAGVFLRQLPHYVLEVGQALLPIVLFFSLFQVLHLKLPRRELTRLAVGMLYTFLGLVLFLTGVNVAFMPTGNMIGSLIAALPYRWILVPIGMLIGYYIVKAEPAVHVLTSQVEEITAGCVSRGAMMGALSAGVSISIGLAMLRMLTGISIWFYLVPGYALALGLQFFVPPVISAIAFDSGGVASGPMTATFLLPFAIGACERLGGNVFVEAFGIVAMVAMTPLITIQLMGLIYGDKSRLAPEEAPPIPAEAEEIIDL
ncbi:MAG TPA: DUF1538 domain-containing protein [Terriglobales bacterium]|nr:DUF1538 domain-containing protein [Terriglobales bacterium]